MTALAYLHIPTFTFPLEWVIETGLSYMGIVNLKGEVEYYKEPAIRIKLGYKF